MSIKELRKSLDLTQKEVSELVSIPLRTYLNYENDESKKGTIKYNYIMEKLEEYGYIDEEHGLLTIEKGTIPDKTKVCKTILHSINKINDKEIKIPSNLIRKGKDKLDLEPCGSPMKTKVLAVPNTHGPFPKFPAVRKDKRDVGQQQRAL